MQKIHLHAAGAKDGNQEISRSKGGLTQRYTWPWMRIMPLRVFITDGTTADCTQAARLIDGISSNHLLDDKGYDSDEIIKQLED